MGKKNSNISGKEYYDMLIAKEQYKQLTKPFYKKLDVLKVMVTTLLTFASIFILYKNGVFDFRTKELQVMTSALEVKKANLEYDLKIFTSSKDSMYSNKAKLENDIATLKAQLIQIDIAKQMAYDALPKRAKYIADIFQKNFELEKKNLSLQTKLDSRPNIEFSVLQNTPAASSSLSSFLGSSIESKYSLGGISLDEVKYPSTNSIDIFNSNGTIDLKTLNTIYLKPLSLYDNTLSTGTLQGVRLSTTATEWLSRYVDSANKSKNPFSFLPTNTASQGIIQFPKN